MHEFRELRDELDRQLHVLADLLKIEAEKSQVIIRGDVPELDRLLNSEQSLLMRSARGEEKRQQILKGLGLENMTISQVIRDFSNAHDLLGVYEKLLDTLSELRKKSGLNQRLLKTRLDVIDHLLSETGMETAIYGTKDGRVEEKKEQQDSTALLNQKA